MEQESENIELEKTNDETPETVKKIINSINVESQTRNFTNFSTDELRDAYDWMRRMIAKKIDDEQNTKIDYESKLIKIIHDEVSERWNQESKKNNDVSYSIKTNNMKNEDTPTPNEEPDETSEISTLIEKAKEEMKDASKVIENIVSANVVRKPKTRSRTKSVRTKKKQREPTNVEEDKSPEILKLLDKARKDKEKKEQMRIPAILRPRTSSSRKKKIDGESPEIIKLIEKAKGEISSANNAIQTMAVKKRRGAVPRRAKTKQIPPPIPQIVPKIKEPLKDKVKKLEGETKELRDTVSNLTSSIIETKRPKDKPVEEFYQPDISTDMIQKDNFLGEPENFIKIHELEYNKLNEKITKLKQERDTLDSDVYNMKMQFNTAKLRYERLQKSLEYTRLALIESARQSNIFSKIKEIDNLKHSLDEMKNDLAKNFD